MFIIIPGAFNAQTGVPGGSQQGQIVTVGSILKVTERDRRPYPTDVGTPSEIWIDNTAGIGYICKEFDTGHGTVWDRLDLLGDFVTFGDSDPGVIQDIRMGYRPGSLRYARNSEILWICKDNTQGAAVWDVLSSGGGVVSVNGLTGVVQLYLDDILDVDAATPNDGDVLTWDSATSTWIATPSTSSITLVASEGLKLNPSNPYDIQLGSSADDNTANITGSRYINAGTIGNLNIKGTLFDPFGKGIFHVENQFILSGGQTPTAITGYSTGRGITGYSFGSGIFSSGVFADALTGYGLWANSNTGVSIKSVSQRNKVFEGVRSADISEEGSVVEMAYYLRNTSGSVGTNGVGYKFVYDISGGTSGYQAHEIVHKWVNVTAGTQLSQYEIWGNRYGTLQQHFTLKGTGQLQLNNYTGTTFDATATKTLGVDASGNVITFTAGSGTGYVPTTRTLTINGTNYDLSADRSWTVGDLLSSGSYADPTWLTSLAYSKLTGAPTIPTVGTWGALNYPTWVSGTPFVKMTAAGTFALDTNTYLTSVALNDLTDVTISSPADDQVLAYDSATSQWVNQTITTGAATQMVTVGRNSTGSTLYQGTIVYISGSTGNRPNFVKAQANAESTSAGTFGVIKADIANNADGECVTIGTIDNLDTRSGATNPFTSDTLVDGDTIYLSPTTAGYITRVKPYAPNHLVYVGKVVRTSPTNGTIVYRIQNGYEMDELHNVQAQSPNLNDTLYYDTADSQWKTTSVNTLLNPSIKAGSCSVVFDGAGGVITSGTTAYAQVPYNGTIASWTIVSSVSGSCTVTVFKDTYANFPPIISTDNVFTVQPALATQVKNQNLSPTFVGSQVTVTTGDWIGFTISGITTATWVNLTLSITKTV